MGSDPLHIALASDSGRMGQALARLIDQADDLIAGPVLGRDYTDTKALQDTDALIDFTLPDATAGFAETAATAGVPLVVGTTGLDQHASEALDKAAQSIPVLAAANMSLGVNLLAALVQQVAATLSADQADIDIVEMHHRHKRDAPSGTALMLGKAAADGRGVDLQDVRQDTRSGDTGERPSGEIGFATLRGGDIAGDHSVHFAATGELLTLSHRATSRDVFANGALVAARWLVNQPAGRYTMADCLGL
ncbi:MAG: 4-hydroxy-tetrahydrodipicolinate reductase [Alphaproteobacteria bacterium]